MASTFVTAFEILSFGAIIVLVVLGLGIIASMMGIFNFAQGEFVLLGAYITYLAFSRGIPIWAGMVAAPFIVGGLGFVLEALIIRRFYAAPIVAMLGTYALGLIIRETVRGLIGGFYLTVPEPIGGSLDIGAMHISAWRFTIIIITLLVMAGCYLLLARTSFGLRVRATLEIPSTGPHRWKRGLSMYADRTNLTRRRFLSNLAFTTGAVATGVGSWVIPAGWANATEGPIKVGIATDLTGPIAYAGNADANVA